MSLFLSRSLQQDADGAITLVTPELERAAYWTEYLALFLADGSRAHRTPRRRPRVAPDRGRFRGFINHPFLATHDPFLEALRGRDAFDELMQQVKRRWQAFAW